LANHLSHKVVSVDNKVWPKCDCDNKVWSFFTKNLESECGRFHTSLPVDCSVLSISVSLQNRATFG